MSRSDDDFRFLSRLEDIVDDCLYNRNHGSGRKRSTAQIETHEDAQRRLEDGRRRQEIESNLDQMTGLRESRMEE